MLIEKSKVIDIVKEFGEWRCGHPEGRLCTCEPIIEALECTAERVLEEISALPTPSPLKEVEERNAALSARVERLSIALQALARRGMHADVTPTHKLMGSVYDLEVYYTTYLRSINDFIKKFAEAALHG